MNIANKITSSIRNKKNAITENINNKVQTLILRKIVRSVFESQPEIRVIAEQELANIKHQEQKSAEQEDDEYINMVETSVC